MIHNISNLPSFRGLKQRVVWLANEVKTLGTWTGNQISSILNLLGIFQTDLQQAQSDIYDLQAIGGLHVYQLDLYKSDINALHTTPITVTKTHLGLDASEFAIPTAFTLWKYRDAVDFASANAILRITPYAGTDVTLLDNTQLEASSDKTYAAVNHQVIASTDISSISATMFTIDSNAIEVTGGGANAVIQIKIYYYVVDKTFVI